MKRVFLFMIFIALIYASQGEKLYNKHGCYGCHGIDGAGTNGFPKLSYKSKVYLVNRLLGYKEERINSNRADMMKPYAKALTKKEIEEIATYLSSPKKAKEYYEEEYDLSDAM